MTFRCWWSRSFRLDFRVNQKQRIDALVLQLFVTVCKDDGFLNRGLKLQQSFISLQFIRDFICCFDLCLEVSKEGIEAWALIGHGVVNPSRLLNPVFCRHTHEGLILGRFMVRRIVVKFGGALITKKDEQCVARIAVIRNLCSAIHSLTEDGVQVIVVHGAGSFGHLKAKRWRLNEGYIDGYEVQGDACSSQIEAVEQVRSDMLNLNAIVVAELEKFGNEVHSHPPHQWARNLGPDFNGTLSRFSSTDPSVVHVSFGDVVDVDDDRRFGILSGDDVVARLSMELPHVESLIFAMGGVDGLLRVPPNEATENDLIEQWSPTVDYVGIHHAEIDVTGGIGLKLNRGYMVAQTGIGVHLVNGEYPSRMLAIVRKEPWRGTSIIP